MESMRSLNTSLPGASPSKPQATEPPEQLLGAFKAAALSVTKLYKTAAADQARARSEGYQDALDELLTFLDKEDIGLSDGEGWRVRRWATARLDGRDTVSQHTESEDETGEKTERTSSPEIQRPQSTPDLPTNDTEAPQPTSSERPEVQASPTLMGDLPDVTLRQGDFTFRSSVPYPQDTDIMLSDLDLSDSKDGQNEISITPHLSNPPITITRPPRSSPRNNGHGRQSTRSSSVISRAAGQKRKINIAEFFDISNAGHGREGGGKRGKFS